jgi:hypothetical protein
MKQRYIKRLTDLEATAYEHENSIMALARKVSQLRRALVLGDEPDPADESINQVTRIGISRLALIYRSQRLDYFAQTVVTLEEANAFPSSEGVDFHDWIEMLAATGLIQPYDDYAGIPELAEEEPVR